MLPIVGCTKQAGVPLSIHVCAEDYVVQAGIPTNAPALVVSQVLRVAGEPAQRKVTIKLSPPDAGVIEKLTTDNPGKKVVIVQGTNVLATPRITGPILARAAIVFRINTNVDFERTYRELVRLSSE
jgi:hypothetical protein